MLEQLMVESVQIEDSPVLRLCDRDEFGEIDAPYEESDLSVVYSDDYKPFDFRTSNRFVKGEYDEVIDSEFVGEMYDPDYEDLKEQIMKYNSESLYSAADEEENIKKDLKDDDSISVLKDIRDRIEKEGADEIIDEEEYEEKILEFDYNSARLYNPKRKVSDEEEDNTISLTDIIKKEEIKTKKAA